MKNNMKELFLYTFQKHTIAKDEVEKLTREQCVKMYATHKCDRLTIQEFQIHHNEGMIDLTNVYITIK